MTAKRQVRIDADLADALDARRGDRSLSSYTNLVLRQATHTAVDAAAGPTTADPPIVGPQADQGPPGPNGDGQPAVGRGSSETSHTAVSADAAAKTRGSAVKPGRAVTGRQASSGGRRTGVRGPGTKRPTSTCHHPIGRRIGVYCAACGNEVR